MPRRPAFVVARVALSAVVGLACLLAVPGCKTPEERAMDRADRDMDRAMKMQAKMMKQMDRQMEEMDRQMQDAD